MAENSQKYVKACVNLLMAVLVILGAVFLAPKIIMLFMPFIIGWFLAVLASPFVRFLENKLKIRRKAGSALVIILVIAGICFLIYLMVAKLMKEAENLGTFLPRMWRMAEIEILGIKQKWSQVMDGFPEDMVWKVEKIAGNIEDNIEGKVSTLIGELGVPAMGNFAQNITGMAFKSVMCLLSAYFFVSEKNSISASAQKYLPETWIKKLVLLRKTTLDVMTEYLKAQLKIEFWVYLVMVAGFLFLKVKYGYLLAVGIAFLDFLPVFGTGAVLIPWAVFKILSGQYMFAVGLLAIWGIGQLLRQMIQPKVIGDSAGIAPFPTLVLLYLGYKIAGVAGMIFAVPLGMLVVAMNGAGFFEVMKQSILILWLGLQKNRQFTKEDLQGIDYEKKL